MKSKVIIVSVWDAFWAIWPIPMLFVHIGQEFQALFLSTTEPVDSAGNTTNPTKSPCDPYVFNTVLTRSKSLVVVVGNPVALLSIEGHMVTQYGRKAQCWSSFLKLCLENKSFVIPSTVEKNRLIWQEFELRLKVNLFQNEVSKAQLANFVTLKKSMNQPPPPSMRSSAGRNPVNPGSLKPSQISPQTKRTSGASAYPSPSKPQSSKQQQNSPLKGHASTTGLQRSNVFVSAQISPPAKHASATQYPSVSVSSKQQQSLSSVYTAAQRSSVLTSKQQQTTENASASASSNRKKGKVSMLCGVLY